MTPALDTPREVPPGPVRTCIGCRQRTAKSELLRVVAGAGADGQPAVCPDPGGRAPGRGAHLHPTTECLDQAVRRRAFTRALRVTVGLSDVLLREHLDQIRETTDRNWSSSS
ncbi:YlxR family protein [Nocardioides islandensis]|uniref:YlxR family protein n=1 Tax=Nocardioides islandensis TaxID=433663 RepID=A0A930VI12_9ACTN|nr:YlxR family protein [Nocardioides islandensis]MBF4765991.1 YlxR family protein [Nocardioides islandensis]